jgi:invasion protein IalB
MTTSRIHLALILGLAALPAAAQDAPAPDAPATEAPATDAPATDAPAPDAPAADAPATDAPVPDNGLSMGIPTGDGIGSQYVAATFEQWEQRCIRTEDGSDPCQLYQLLKDPQGNAVAEISLFNLPEGGEAAAGATIVAPLETLLTENLRLAVDGGSDKIYPFSWCSEMGCVARVGFTAEEVAQFKAGNGAVVTIVPVVAPDQKVTLAMSLAGFTAGYDAVTASNPAPAPAE